MPVGATNKIVKNGLTPPPGPQGGCCFYIFLVCIFQKYSHSPKISTKFVQDLYSLFLKKELPHQSHHTRWIYLANLDETV